MDHRPRDVAAVAALDDPLRRRMYDYVRSAGRAVARDEVAEHAGTSRKLAAFHLDKLVERGLLTARYGRPPGAGERRVGRAPKLYEPSDATVAVSIPQRRYELLGEILVDAIESAAADEPARAAARRASWERGRAAGAAARAELRLRPPGPERTLALAHDVLRDHGYEPYRAGRVEVALRNCPFHDLARRAPELVCGLNREFVDGLLRGLGNDDVEAALEPVAGECCVRVRAPGGAR